MKKQNPQRKKKNNKIIQHISQKEYWKRNRGIFRKKKMENCSWPIALDFLSIFHYFIFANIFHYLGYFK